MADRSSLTELYKHVVNLSGGKAASVSTRVDSAVCGIHRQRVHDEFVFGHTRKSHHKSSECVKLEIQAQSSSKIRYTRASSIVFYAVVSKNVCASE